MAIMIPLPPETAESPEEVDISPHENEFFNEVNSIIEKYLEPYSPHTVDSYRNDMATFFDITNKNLVEITELDIIDYVKALEMRRFKNATINRKIYSLSKVFEIYKKLGLVKKNLVRTLAATTRINKRTNRIINLEIDLRDVQKVVENANRRTGLIVKVLANTGLRISELINIRPVDFKEFNRNYLKIRILGKGDKERFIYLSYDLLSEIKDVFSQDSEYLFHSKSGQKLSRTNLHKQVSRSFKRHTGKQASPHSLRHFFSTYKIGVEKRDVKSVSNYLGHSRVSITLEMYTHTSLAPEESHIL